MAAPYGTLSPTRPRVVFLAHGAERGGPPIYLLHVLRWLVVNTDIDARVVLLSGGPLESQFAELVPYRILDRLHGGVLVSLIARAAGPRVGPVLRRAMVRHRLRSFGGSSLVYVNTAGSVHALPFLPRAHGPVVSHIHELDVGMRLHLRPADRDLLLEVSARYIAVAHAVADNLVKNHAISADRITVHYGMIDVSAADRRPSRSAESLRAELKIPADALVLGSVGKPIWRKGPDLFIRLAQRLIARSERELHMLWVGSDTDGPPPEILRRDVQRAGLAGRVHFVGEVDNPLDYLRTMDVFVLTAREDAYPLVCLEAASLAIPLVVFDRGGIPEFVCREDEPAGFVVPYPDLEAMALRIEQLLADAPLRLRLGRQGRENVAVHDIGVAAPLLAADILDWCAASTRKLST